MPTTDPGELSSIQGSAVFSFNDAARIALAEFPALQKKKVAFVDGNHDFAVVSARPRRGLRGQAKEFIASQKNAGPMAVRMTQADGKKRRFIYFVDTRNVLSQIRDKSDRDTFIFDHEVGHMITKRGSRSLSKIAGTGVGHPITENAADAYAALRHIQRRSASGRLNNLSWERSLSAFIDGDVTHFTSIVLDKVLACDPGAVRGLAPAEVARLADRFAAAYTPSDATLARFVKLTKGMHEKATEGSLKEKDFIRLAQATVMQDEDKALFYAGAIFFQRFAGEGICVNGHIVSLKGAFWSKVAERITHDAEGRPRDFREAVPDQPVLADFLAGNPPPPDQQQVRKAAEIQRKPLQKLWAALISPF